MEAATRNFPVLALQGITAFPKMHLTFDIDRPICIAALEHAMQADQLIFLVSQKKISAQEPVESDLYTIGTVARIHQAVRLTERFVRISVEGQCRARLKRLWQTTPYCQALVELLPEEEETVEGAHSNPKVEALLRQTYSLFVEYASQEDALTDEAVQAVVDCSQPGYLADLIAQNLPLRHTDKQAILEELSPVPRLRKLNQLLAKEGDVLHFEHELAEKVYHQLNQSQKEQILRTQIRVLQNELGETEAENGDEELKEYRHKILALHLPEEVENHLMKEVHRIARQPFGGVEASVSRNYLDVCLEVPWNKRTRERLNVETVRKTLDKDHFGLSKVKERILEFIAARKMNPEGKGQILCLVGPPGVGKTSVAISVAKALNRKLGRISLGGVRDEADIRGHRKTYVGAMPGRIIEAITRSGSMNPLLLLDEVDKMGNDLRGDPASALLEVLDSEQNHAFRDHFLEVPVDLSKVFFIATANTTDPVPRPLLDRMEVIHLPSYTDEEKLEIAKQHLVPKQLKEHGLKKSQLRIGDDTLRTIIQNYTRESGVRNLERQIGKLCRKTDMRLLDGETKRVTVTPEDLQTFLGVRPYPPTPYAEREEVGVVNGLAWTEMGGEILEVEVNVMDGSGKLELTGNLGDVMKESVQAAVSCLRSRTRQLGIDPNFHKDKDIHVHFPEGAVPKDGPSAGIAVTTAILSALTNRKIQSHLAMTGEVTLRGRVLAIGGLREKTMAAKRYGIRTVLFPKDNLADLDEIDPVVRDALTFIPVSNVDEVFAHALCQPEQTEQPAIEPKPDMPTLRPESGLRIGARLS